MQRRIILCFEDIFPDEEKKEASFYLRDIHKNEVFQLAANFARINRFESPQKEVFHALEAFFGKENHDLANQIYIKTKQLNPSRYFYNPVSSLILLEQAYLLDIEEKTKDYQKAEIALFKAYLSINSYFTKQQEKAFDTTKSQDPELRFPLMTFCSMYPDHDKSNYVAHEQIICQTIKASYLFKYLEELPKVTPLLKEFCSLFHVDKWESYVQKIFPLLNSIANHDEGHLKIQLDLKQEHYDINKNFLNALTLKFDGEDLEVDFLVLRNTPIVKLEEDLYLIVFDLFVIEKLYKGIYFTLSAINKGFTRKEQIDIRGLFTLGFSEKTLLYKAMEEIYPEAQVKFTGEELDKQNIDGAPDYYIRQDKQILLMESKDILVDKDIKYSYNFSAYEPVFEEKLYGIYNDKKDKWKRKAVLQLTKSIENILNKDNSFDDDYNPKKVIIHPVIILHDFQYDVPGLEYWINTWFQEKIEELRENGYYVTNIRALSIINIDSLLLHSENLLQDVGLIELLEIRHRRKKPMLKRKFKNEMEWENHQFEQIEPFSLFINNYLVGRGIRKYPKLSEKVSLALFDNKEEELK